MKKIVVALMSLTMGTLAAAEVALQPTVEKTAVVEQKMSMGPRKRFRKMNTCYYRSGGRCLAPAR